MEKKTVSAIMLTLLLTSMLTMALHIQPAKAYSEGTTYEEFGPRADKLLIKLYPNETAEWDALARGEIDIADWPLSKPYNDLFTSDAINPATGLPYNETITTFSCPESDLCILDINNNNNPYLGNPQDPTYPNPVYPNPTSVKQMRQAIAYLTDRNQLTAIIGEGFYTPLYTVVPPLMGEYAHPEIRPGGLLEHLTYSYSRANAEAKLDSGGFPVSPSTGWRFWDRNGDGVEQPNEYLELKFFIRNDDEYRLAFGNFLADELNAVKVKVNRTYGEITAARFLVMQEKNFHIYTGGWSLGITPENLLILWNWDNYWHPGSPYNYAGIDNAQFDEYSYGVMHAATFYEAKTNAWLAQEVFASEALSVPLFSPLGNKAISRLYTGGNKWTPVTPDDGENVYRGKYWDGVVNISGYAIDNEFSFLDMHPRDFERGGTIRWGFKKTNINWLNPIYSEWLWDWNILNSIYDSLLVRNPYNQSELIPWLAQDFEVGTYNNPVYGECSKIKFTLRPDAAWSDGNPITAADVYFTFVELPKMLKARSFPFPWWYSSVENILDFKIFDPYNFEVLLNTKSVFAVGWLAQRIILPKHVWKPIVEAGDLTTFAPDPNMIGSGPWRLVEYVQGSRVLLVANKPGSAVKTNLPGSRVVVSPQGYFGYSPISIDAFTSVINRFTPAEANFNTTIRNNLPESVTIDYLVRHEWPNGSVTVQQSNSAVVIPGFNSLTLSLPSGGSVYGKHERVVEVIITEPQWVATTVDVTEPYWVTEIEDLNLDFFVNVQDCVIVGKAWGSYPGHVRWNGAADINDDYKIDPTDVYLVQRRANASEWMAPEPQPSPVSLTVSPSSAIVTANTNLTVNVTVNNVVNLRGYQFTLFYNSTVLDLMKAEPNWIYSPWYGVNQINDNYNSTHGKYTQASYVIESSSPLSFNGTAALVTLTFQSVQDGFSFFNLANTLLVDLDAEQIPHVRVPWTPAPPAPDFSITACPTSLTIQQGTSDSSIITIASINGFDQLVTLTKGVMPSGVTALLSSQFVAPGPGGSETSTLTVTVDSTAAPGSYSITVNGTSGSLVHETEIYLNIVIAEPLEISVTVVQDPDFGIYSARMHIYNKDSQSYTVAYGFLTANDEVLNVANYVRGTMNLQYVIPGGPFEMLPSGNAFFDIVFDPRESADLGALTNAKLKIEYSTEWGNIVKYEPLHFEAFDYVAATNFNMTRDAYSFSNNEWGGDGKCYGMAATSALYFSGKIALPEQRTTYSLSMEEAGPRIDDYQDSWLNKFSTGWIGLAGNKLNENRYNVLRDTIQKGEPMIFIMSKQEQQGKTIHAVAAYKILETKTMAYIIIYDNIWSYTYCPSDTTMSFRYITYDFASKELRYEAYTDFKLVNAEMDWWHLIKLNSAGELRIYDSENRVAGLVNGEVRQEIPLSSYDEENETITIYYPDDIYRYVVVGMYEGTYGLEITSIEDENTANFSAIDIPTAPNAAHQYIIDWIALSLGEEGVTVQVDSDSDGVFEDTLTSDTVLTQSEFLAQTVPPPLTVSITPLSASILVGQSVTFTSTVSGGVTPYDYQWYVNSAPVPSATSASWTFTPSMSGIYYVYLKATDASSNTFQSETARITAATIPVGGYSYSIQFPAKAEPILPYIALIVALTAIFTKMKPKTRRKR